MCLGVIGFANVSGVSFAVRREHVTPKYFVYLGLTLENFLKAAKHDLAEEGGRGKENWRRFHVPNIRTVSRLLVPQELTLHFARHRE